MGHPMSRRLTLLLTVVVMPGGLVLLASILLMVAFARSARGRRALAAMRRRLPARLCHPVRHLLGPARGEKPFLSGVPPVGPTHSQRSPRLI